MLSLEQLRDALWTHLRQLLGDSYNWTICCTFMDQVIVQRFPGQLFSYPITIAADNSVTLGAPVQGEMVFKPLSGMTEALKRARRGDGLWLGPIPLAEGLSADEIAEKKNRQWSAVLITEGMSANGRLYTAPALQGAVQLCEGVRAYWTHAAAQASEPDPRNQAGFFSGCKYGLLEASGRGMGAILGTFNATDPVARERLAEAFDAGNPGMFGLSINATGRGTVVRHGDRSVYRVDAIESVSSVDLVSDPAAGGRFLRLVAGLSSPVPVTEEVIVMFERKLKHLRENFPALAARLSANPTEGEVDALLLEAAVAPKAPADPVAAVAAPAPAVPVTENRASAGQSDAERALAAEQAEMRALLVERRVERVMSGQTLPDPLRNHTRATLVALATAGVPETQLRERMTETVQLAASLAAPAAGGSGLATTAGSASAGMDRHHKLLEAVEDYFFGDAGPAVVAMFEAEYKRKPRPNVKRFRPLYEQLTGDRDVSGYITEATAVREARSLMESLNVASWGQVFGNVLNRRMLFEYRSPSFLEQVKAICHNWGQPLADLTRPQRLIRYGSYADLATVAERAPYPDLTTPGDEEATYTPSKRGGIESISREAILADDLSAIRGLPVRIANAARRTLSKFVMDLVITNSTIYDSTALFTSSHGSTADGNLLTDNLSAAAASKVYRIMQTQRDMSSNDYMMLAPRFLIVHPDNHEVGWRIVNPVMQPVDGRNATEPNYLKSIGFSTLIVWPFISTATNWFAVADPATVDTIEVGFVNGQEEPELFAQDQANVGAVFTADVISYKVRHEFGAGITNFRGFVGGIQ